VNLSHLSGHFSFRSYNRAQASIKRRSVVGCAKVLAAAGEQGRRGGPAKMLLELIPYDRVGVVEDIGLVATWLASWLCGCHSLKFSDLAMTGLKGPGKTYL